MPCMLPTWGCRRPTMSTFLPGAAVTLEVIREFQKLPRSRDLAKTDVQAEIAARVRLRLQPIQGALPGVTGPIDPTKVVAEVTAEYIKRNIDIPKIVLTPAGEVTSGYRDFELDVRTIRLQPVAKDILVHHLQSNERERLETVAGIRRSSARRTTSSGA